MIKAIHLSSAVIGGISARSKKNGIKFSVSTPELTSDQTANFFDLQDLVCDVLIQPKDEEFPLITEIKSEVDKKTPSQRLRGVLFVLFSQKAEGHATFASYYESKMNGFIDHLKEKIND